MHDPNSNAGGWEHFKGLLSDPEQMQALQSNPMFNVGMGLLSSRYNSNINPFQAALGGLSSAGKNKTAMEDRKRLEELRKQLAALIAAQQGGGQSRVPPMMSAQNPPQRGILGL